MKTRYLADPSSMPNFKLIDDMLIRQGKIWISPNSHFKQLLLREFHESLVGGHAGVTKTWHRLSENFFWDNMRQEVQTFVR